MRASTYFHLTDTDKAEHMISGPPGRRKLVIAIDEVRLIFSNLEQLVSFAAVIHTAGNIFSEATAPSVAAPDDDEVPIGRETAADVESSMPATAPLSAFHLQAVPSDFTEGEQSLPPTGSASSTARTLPNGMPAVPHKCGDCPAMIDTGLYCPNCLAKMYANIPF